MTRDQLNKLKELVDGIQVDDYQPSNWQIGDCETARAVARFVSVYGQIPLNPAKKPKRDPILVMRLMWRNLTKNRRSVRQMEVDLKSLTLQNRALLNKLPETRIPSDFDKRVVNHG